MNENIDNDIIELIRHYEKNNPNAKLISEAVKNGQAIEMYLFIIEQSKKTNDIKPNPYSLDFLYFLSYCINYNNGSELIAVFSYLFDNSNGKASNNAADSIKTIIQFMNEKGVKLDEIDWPNKKVLSKIKAGQIQGKASNYLIDDVIKELIDKNREKYLSNPIHYEREQKIKELFEKLRVKGFFNLEKVKALNDEGQRILIEKILDNKMPYVMALFEHLGFLNKLYRDCKSNYEMDIFIARIYNPNVTDDTNARRTRGSLSKPKKGYNAAKHIPDVENLYEQLIKQHPR